MTLTLPLQPTADDLAHLESDHNRRYCAHLLDPANAIRQRIIMERAVIRRAVADLIAAGCWLRVFYGAGEGFGCNRTDNVDIVMEAVGACDEEHLYVYNNSSDARRGAIFLVYGNDGWDVMADYSTRLERDLKGANEFAEQIADAA